MQKTMTGARSARKEKVELHPAAEVWDSSSMIIVGLVSIVLCITLGVIGFILSLCLVWFINKLNTRTAEEFTELMNELEREQEKNK
jgi:uncharacterized protein YacL